MAEGYISLFAYHLQTTQNLQDYTTGSKEIHSNPVAITNNKWTKNYKHRSKPICIVWQLHALGNG